MKNTLFAMVLLLIPSSTFALGYGLEKNAIVVTPTEIEVQFAKRIHPKDLAVLRHYDLRDADGTRLRIQKAEVFDDQTFRLTVEKEFVLCSSEPRYILRISALRLANGRRTGGIFRLPTFCPH